MPTFISLHQKIRLLVCTQNISNIPYPSQILLFFSKRTQYSARLSSIYFSFLHEIFNSGGLNHVSMQENVLYIDTDILVSIIIVQLYRKAHFINSRQDFASFPAVISIKLPINFYSKFVTYDHKYNYKFGVLSTKENS